MNNLHKNMLKRAQIIKSIVDENYEPGRLDRCKSQVFRNIVYKNYPMSERTFWRLLELERKCRLKEFDKYQLRIDFDDETGFDN
jgi:hypothetical protein